MECLSVSVVVEFAAGGSANNRFTPSSLCTYLTTEDHTQETCHNCCFVQCCNTAQVQVLYCTVQYKYCTAAQVQVLYCTVSVLG